jgi:peptidoglycan/LPS O-acetylase OafA/YrhL
MPKRPDIEWLRLVSALGIVWFHAGASGIALAYSGLVVFLVLSVALGGRSGAPDGATLRRRALRLLRPWLLWFGLYAAFNLARGLPALPLEQGLLAGVLAGPSIHLWYLPFVFGVLGGLDVLRAHVAPRTLSAAAFGLALLVLATAPWWRPVTLDLPYPLLQWADATAPVLAGIFALGAGHWTRPVALAMAALLLAAAAGLAAFEWVGTPYAVGLGAAFWMLLRVPAAVSGRPAVFSTLTDCAFGIYLSHSLVFALLLGVPWLPAEALPLAIFALAWAGTWALRRWAPRLAAWVS